jgi:hypothetical protein
MENLEVQNTDNSTDVVNTDNAVEEEKLTYKQKVEVLSAELEILKEELIKKESAFNMLKTESEIFKTSVKTGLFDEEGIELAKFYYSKTDNSVPFGDWLNNIKTENTPKALKVFFDGDVKNNSSVASQKVAEKNIQTSNISSSQKFTEAERLGWVKEYHSPSTSETRKTELLNKIKSAR